MSGPLPPAATTTVDGRPVASSGAVPAGSAAAIQPTRALLLAAFASLTLVALLISVRLATAGMGAAPAPSEPLGGDPYAAIGSAIRVDLPLGPLLAVAALCLVGLGLRRSLALAWLAAVGADAIVAADLTDVGLLVRAPDGLTATAPLAGALCLALIAAVATAVGYASAPERRLHRAVGWLGAVCVAWLIVGSVVSVGAIQTELVTEARASVLRWVSAPVRWWHYAAVGFVGLGILGDVAAADRRARRRSRGRVGARPAAAGPIGARLTDRLNERVPPLLEELLPGRAAARDQAIEAERARLAAELHADVVPAVRRALEAVEAGGSVERLATDLRDVLGEVEGLLAQRRSIVLEELGLVAGLEWLAERVEERGSTLVTLDVRDEPPGTAPGRPPRAVERAVFRIAALALDNATRHAPGAAIGIGVLATPARVDLTVADDGPGIADARPAAARAAGRRGLADMSVEAASIGAALSIEPADPHGAVIRLAWTAADR